MDAALRAAERTYASDPTPEHRALLKAERARADRLTAGDLEPGDFFQFVHYDGASATHLALAATDQCRYSLTAWVTRLPLDPVLGPPPEQWVRLVTGCEACGDEPARHHDGSGDAVCDDCYASNLRDGHREGMHDEEPCDDCSLCARTA